MEKKMICHHNLFGHEINDSLEFYADDVLDREIYCRRKHLIVEPVATECEKCPCFAGTAQGHGCMCTWLDIEHEDFDIRHENRYREYERIDKLIKLGRLDAVKDIPEFNVKSTDYDESVWIYKQSKDMKNRFLLGKRGKKNLICCGVNPSTASPENLDPTMRKVEKIAENNGYDGYIMINLYPMRSTDPKKMHTHADEDIIIENIESIKSILSEGNYEIWAAWGRLIEEREYLKECLERVAKVANTYNCKWITFGELTKDDHPRHPLFLNTKSKKSSFDMQKYLQGFE